MSELTKLTDVEKATLLIIARSTLESYIVDRRRPDAAGFPLTAALREKRGAFVTLTKGGNLRGCIGYVEGVKPLWQTVMENVVNAAVGDPRFAPVEPPEVDRIRIEISAMTPCVVVRDFNSIEVGEHGLMITLGGYRGLLLPQVATEYGWTREEFLANVCHKAGLPEDACFNPNARVESFCAEVFHEGGDQPDAAS